MEENILIEEQSIILIMITICPAINVVNSRANVSSLGSHHAFRDISQMSIPEMCFIFAHLSNRSAIASCTQAPPFMQIQTFCRLSRTGWNKPWYVIAAVSRVRFVLNEKSVIVALIHQYSVMNQQLCQIYIINMSIIVVMMVNIHTAARTTPD